MVTVPNIACYTKHSLPLHLQYTRLFLMCVVGHSFESCGNTWLGKRNIADHSLLGSPEDIHPRGRFLLFSSLSEQAVVFVADSFPRFHDMAVPLGPHEQRHLFQRYPPTTVWEFHTSLTLTLRYAIWALSFFPSRIKAIRIQVDDILISSSFNIFLHSVWREVWIKV